MAGTQVTVGPRNADFCGSDNKAIQAAVDAAAAKGGGMVRILPGVYRMDDSLHLRPNVRVEGSGPKTVLRKAPEVRSELSADLGYGHFDISLAEPDRFAVGMGVIVGDDQAHGFYQTVATLTWREGDRFGIGRMLNHDYSRCRHGFVVSSFPVVSASSIERASLSSLAIDGNREENPFRLNGCRGGGVFLIQSHGVALRDVHVSNMNADAISFQQCSGTVVEDCICEDNAGLGLHPGSGSVGAILRRCTCRRNGEDGIFYCLRVSFSLCEGCTITDNAGHGISIGGRDTDHLIRGNTIHRNGRAGIFFRESDRVMAGNRNQIEGNDLADNCRAAEDAEVLVAAPVCEVHILRNRITPARNVAGIRLVEGTEGVVVNGNQIDCAPEKQIVIEGERSAVRFEEPDRPLAVGPGSALEGAVRHLSA